MKYWQTPLLFLYSLWCYTTFFLFAGLGVLWYIIVLFVTSGKGITVLYWYNHWWAIVWGFLTGIRYKVTGREYFEKGQSYVVCSNHISNADLFIVAAAFTVPYRVLGKVELTKIPVVGYLFRKALVIVDRSNVKSRRRSMEAMKTVLEQNVSILVFPEGTRNRTGKPLKFFYDGAFRLAVESGKSIVPMLITNTGKVFRNGQWMLRPGLLQCDFYPPIQTNGLSESDIPKLKDRVFEFMYARVLECETAFQGYKEFQLNQR